MSHIYVIAGEASGDVLGGKLLTSLKSSVKKVTFSGVGGDAMEKAGLASLFPMSDLALMGFAEIVPHLPKLRRRLAEVVADIIQKKPDVVVTIDSPGFNFRVAEKLQGMGIPLVHYVAPSVWAYKPERAEKVARLYDHLLMLLPFEASYFKTLDIKAHYVGHPIVEDRYEEKAAQAFRKRHHIKKDTLLLSVLPGSRSTEIQRLLPIFTEAINGFVRQEKREVTVVVPVVKWLEEDILFYMESFCNASVVCVSDKAERMEAYSASDLALAKSGTGALELSLARTPLVVAYKVNPLSYWFIKRMIQTRFVNLINITAGEACIEEFIQGECTAIELCRALKRLSDDKKKQKKQLKSSDDIFQLWGKGQSPTPSEKAASLVLQAATAKNAK